MTQWYNADIYVLTKDRSMARVRAFLEQFLPYRKEMAEDYELPQYAASPREVFTTAEELMEYCAKHETAAQTIYWSSTIKGEPETALVRYTSDKACILGLSIKAGAAEDSYLKKLKAFAASHNGYITYETPPADTRETFMKILKDYQTSNPITGRFEA